jgi:hypothetical protein
LGTCVLHFAIYHFFVLLWPSELEIGFDRFLFSSFALTLSPPPSFGRPFFLSFSLVFPRYLHPRLCVDSTVPGSEGMPVHGLPVFFLVYEGWVWGSLSLPVSLLVAFSSIVWGAKLLLCSVIPILEFGPSYHFSLSNLILIHPPSFSFPPSFPSIRLTNTTC